MSFANLKRSRGNFADLSKKLDNEKKGYGGSDNRYWELKVDDSGNGYAVIRFLPAPDGEEYPFVKLYSHGFKDERTNKWYIENSRTTLGESDPVSDANTELWNTGIPANQEIVRKRKRRQSYISNILVIDDPKNPQNNGKVFLYKYGQRIFQKIEGALKPEFQDETPFNPFDLWEGANFKLKARKLDGQRSYDKSEFSAPEALFGGDDDALEKLWKSQYSLQAEIAPDKFKSFEELQKRFLAVTGAAQPSQSRAAQEEAAVERQFSGGGTSTADRFANRGGAPAPSREETRPAPAPAPAEEEDDPMARYRSLLDD